MSAVDDVKARLDIVEVVGGYTRLQKAGRYFRAVCPFHQEKTPSFYVYPERQSWHCFGACATGGDVIAFVSKKENLDFQGTLRLLADRAGVELRSDGPRREQIKTLQDANEAAALYFHGLLQNSAAARAYIEERQLDNAAVTDFLIGYAPPGWDNLREHLTKRNFAEAQLIEAGLLIEGDRGPYDRFRERLMFPIRDERGRVVGFGGRILPGTAQSYRTETGPKYLNTPQTPIFDKGSVLYGLDRAREDVRQQSTAVIVEGYMDVIAAHQHGFRNVVASMGTALTDRQATLLQRFADRVVLAMDADAAGTAANLRAIQVVATAAQRPARSATTGRDEPRSLEIRVLALPHGKDPDELIRADIEAWPRAVATARPVVDHLIAVVSAGLDLAEPRDRSTLVADVLPAVAEVGDPVLQAHYLQRLSRLARVSEDALRRQMPRRTRPSQRHPSTVRPGSGSGATESDETPASEGAAPVVNAKALRSAREEFALAMLYLRPEIAAHGQLLTEDLFGLSENRELFRRWRDGETVSEDETELYEHLQGVLATRIPVQETGQAEEAFLDCVGRLKQGKMKAVKEASALALAEGVAGVRSGQVVAIARARQETGNAGEDSGDEQAEAAAQLLLDDTEAGLKLYRPLIEGSRPDQSGRRAQ
jgi:DNA primase